MTSSATVTSGSSVSHRSSPCVVRAARNWRAHNRYSPLRLSLRMAYTPLVFSIDVTYKTPGPITCEETVVYDVYDSASPCTNQYTCNPNRSHQYRLHMHHHRHHNIASRTGCAYLCSVQAIKMRIAHCKALTYHSGGTTTSCPPQHISAGMFPWTSQILLSPMPYQRQSVIASNA